MSALLSVRDLTIRFGDKIAVNAANLDVQPGEIVGIVGESGSGKTMLGRSLLRLVPPDATVSGKIRFGDRDVLGLSSSQLQRLRGAEVGLVFQEPLTALNPALTIGVQLTEGLMLHRQLSRPDALEQACDMLRRVGFAEPDRTLQSYPHESSGGMRQRIMLAGVMLLRPRLLIADEPTTALDSLSQHDVLDLMQTLTQAAGTAILLISHDLGLVASHATNLIVMQSGRIVEQGAAASILARPTQSYTRALLDAVPRRRHLPSRPNHEQCALEIHRLDVRYPKATGALRRAEQVHAVREVSLSVRRGETVGLVGQSGSGKSSIVRTVLGLEQPHAGSIRIDGMELAQLSRRDPRRRAIGMVFQDPFSSLDPRMRIGDSIAEPLRGLADCSTRERQPRVASALEDVGLPAEFAMRFPHQLSGGQRQRVAIARALIARPRLLLADEPCAALDMTIRAQVLALLRRLQAELGFGCLFISHDLALVEEIAHRVVVLEAGSVVEHGVMSNVLDRPQHPYTRRLVAAFPRLMPRDGGYVVEAGKRHEGADVLSDLPDDTAARSGAAPMA
jgi:peptide/nickel transport system ATP-binding protein